MEPPEETGTFPRVLIVDDSPSALRFLQAVLEKEHYDVITACDGAEALAKVRAYQPDVVVTDSIMPNVDGFALVRKLKRESATGLIPVIMLTAEDPRYSAHLKSQPQPDAIIMKSADMEPLLNEVREALKRR
jgi:DNA-binding response OmpR family regulator